MISRTITDYCLVSSLANVNQWVSVHNGHTRRGIIMEEANQMSDVFQNIDSPTPSPPGGGGGVSVFWKTPDTALYSTYVSTLWTYPTPPSRFTYKLAYTPKARR
jgi:hypothetical protein